MANTMTKAMPVAVSTDQAGSGRLRGIALFLLGFITFLNASALHAVASAADCALLWQVSRDGEPKGYLFGTIHAEDPRVLAIPESVRQAQAGSEAFAMEVIPDADALLSLAQRMHFQDGQNLRGAVGDELYAQVVQALTAYGVGEGVVVKMKPWAVAMTLSVPPPKTGVFLDMQLYLDARIARQRVFGLETVAEQLRFFEKLEMEMQIELLRDALQQQSADAFETLIQAYLKADLTALTAINDEQMQAAPAALSEWLMAEGIERRNLRMLINLLDLMQHQTVFAAVGALHLPGEQGLLALLEQRGYQVSRVGASAAQCARRAAALE